MDAARADVDGRLQAATGGARQGDGAAGRSACRVVAEELRDERGELLDEGEGAEERDVADLEGHVERVAAAGGDPQLVDGKHDEAAELELRVRELGLEPLLGRCGAAGAHHDVHRQGPGEEAQLDAGRDLERVELEGGSDRHPDGLAAIDHGVGELRQPGCELARRRVQRLHDVAEADAAQQLDVVEHVRGVEVATGGVNQGVGAGRQQGATLLGEALVRRHLEEPARPVRRECGAEGSAPCTRVTARLQAEHDPTQVVLVRHVGRVVDVCRPRGRVAGRRQRPERGDLDVQSLGERPEARPTGVVGDLRGGERVQQQRHRADRHRGRAVQACGHGGPLAQQVDAAYGVAHGVPSGDALVVGVDPHHPGDERDLLAVPVGADEGQRQGRRRCRTAPAPAPGRSP